jgi:hypothetical protein
MSSVTARVAAMMSCLLTAGLCGTGSGAIGAHLYWGQILQGRVYDDPNATAPLHFFMMQLETDESVGYVELLTPAGVVDAIPDYDRTAWGSVETYHWLDGATHVWEYWGYFEDAEALGDYGDGWYEITLHYADGAAEATTVWYGIPGTARPIPAPTQRPTLTCPTYSGAEASPVTFTWEPVTDPAATDIYLGVTDANGLYIASQVYDVPTTMSDPCSLPEGRYDIELTLESFYPVTNADGIPFDLLKTSSVLQPFEVTCCTVYRFWSPLTGGHFYTAREGEKDKLVREYADVWLFEGPAFYAWTSAYYPGLAPVYRFWSDVSSSHFYTISEAEKDRLLDDPEAWTYEGVAFHAYPQGAQPAGTEPVYRFWNASSGTHFYTIDVQEVDRVLTAYSHVYTFEGIAFYAWQ